MGGNFVCSLANVLLFCETMIWYNSKSWTQLKAYSNKKEYISFPVQGRGDLREVDGTGHQAQGIALIALIACLHFQKNSRFRHWYCLYMPRLSGGPMGVPGWFATRLCADAMALVLRILHNRVKTWSGEIWTRCNKGLGNFNMIPENLLQHTPVFKD